MIKTLISENWLFKGLNEDCPATKNSKSMKNIDLPHDYAISQPRVKDAPGQCGSGFFNGGIGFYVKYIDFGKKQHTILDIDGAYMCAEIRLNENRIAFHPHGYMPFLVDLTETIVWNSLNKIEIQTNDMQPSSRWYPGAGLYRDVHIWTGGEIRIEPWDLYVVTESVNEKGAKIIVKSQITSDIDENAVIGITISDCDKNVVLSHTEKVSVKSLEKLSKNFEFEIQTPQLWDIENPHLYTIDVKISANNQIVDTYTQKFGIREVKFTAKDGFLLNGKPVKLKGGCIHHDHGALGVCAYPKAEERKIKKLKAAGFNSLRMSHNPPSTAFMEICDREGILLMDEAFDMWCDRKCNLDYHLWFADWWARDISYMVCRDRSHPSIISYSIGNEINEAKGHSNGAIWAEKLAAEIKKYDTSRPVTSAFEPAALVLSNDPWENLEEHVPEEYKRAFYYDKDGVSYGYKKDPDNVAAGWNKHTEKYMNALDIVGLNYLYSKYDLYCDLYPDKIFWGSETHAIDIWHSWKKSMEHNNILGDYTWTAYDNLGEIGAGRIEWTYEDPKPIRPLVINDFNWRSCWQGDFDLAGYRRPQSYFRQMVWSDHYPPKIFTWHPKNNGKKMSGTRWHWYDVNDSWTFEDKYIGEKIKTDVYTKSDEVTYYLNGKKIGTAKQIDGIASLEIPYEKGELKVEAIKGGLITAEAVLNTVGTPGKIRVVPETNEFIADGRDLCYVQIYVCDKDNNIVPDTTNEIRCSVSGGELLCVFSGDPKSKDQYTSDVCHAFNGKAIAVVCTKQPGNVKISVFSPGLLSDAVIVKSILHN